MWILTFWLFNVISYHQYTLLLFSLVNLLLFSRLVVSDSLWPHGLQHTRLPFRSPSPRACSNSCLLSQWRHPTISSSVTPFSSCLNLSQHQGLFQWVSSSHQVAKVLEFQLQHQSFQWIFRTDFLYDWLVGSPCSPRDSQEFSPRPQFKSINSSALSFLYSPTFTQDKSEYFGMKFYLVPYICFLEFSYRCLRGVIYLDSL